MKIKYIYTFIHINLKKEKICSLVLRALLLKKIQVLTYDDRIGIKKQWIEL